MGKSWHLSSQATLTEYGTDALHVTDPKNQETLFHGFLNEPQVWNFASNSDPFVRRAVYKLASTATLKQRDQLDMELMSTSMLVSALSINQTGSALEYVKALALLTAELPTIWTKFYTGSGKKSATKRICHFLRKGSQGGPSDFWVQMSTLIRHLPPNILIPNPDIEPDITLESTTKPSFPVLESLHEGISKRDELRGSQNDAWNTYLIASDRINSLLPSQVTRDYLALHSILPIINQYVKPSPDTAKWTITCSEKEEICVKAFSQVQSISQETFKEAWHHISISIIDDVRSSPPEQSKNYVKSHDLISISIGRWYGIQSAVFELEKSDALENLFAETVESEIETAVFVLRERGGKPYSAAAILLNAVKFMFKVVRMHNGISGMLAEFAQNDIPKLLLSPSAPQLIATLTFLKDLVDVRFICESGVQILRDAPDSIAKSSALKSLVSSDFLAQSAKNEALGNLVQENLNLALLGDDRRWDLVLAAVGNPNAPNSFTDDLLAIIVNGLSIEEKNGASLLGLDLVVKRHGRTIRNFAKSSQGSNLLSKLLFLTESSDPEVSQIANSLSASIEVIVADDKYSNHATRSMIEIINQGIDTARPDSLSYVTQNVPLDFILLLSNQLEALIPSLSKQRNYLLNPLSKRDPF